MTKQKQYRQGDVLLVKIDNLPKGLKEKDKILAMGEVTGHKHQFMNPQVQVFADREGNQFAELKEKSILQHEEHSNLKIPKGRYRVVVAREFDLIEGIRQVMD